jgi:hypothetical protein
MNSVLLDFFWSPSSAKPMITPHFARFTMLLVLAFLNGYSELVFALSLFNDFPPYSNCNILFDIILYYKGMGKGAISSDGDNNRDAYLSLSVTVLAALCRVPEIASSEDMTSMIPLILEVMSTRYDVVLLFSFTLLDLC